MSRIRIIVLLLAVCPGLACSGGQDDAATEHTEITEPVTAAEAQAVEVPPDDAPAPIDTLNDGRTLAARLADATIAARVRKALVEEAGLRVYDFDPVVERGRVLLRGTVRTDEQRERAAAIARRVEGVRDVVNAVAVGDAPGLASAPSGPGSVSTLPPRPPQTVPAQPETKPTSPPESATQAAPATVSHTVRNGESLWAISQRYGVTVDQIKRLNNLRSNDVRPGQQLRVK